MNRYLRLLLPFSLRLLFGEGGWWRERERERERVMNATTTQGRKGDEAEEVDQETPAPKHDCQSHDLHEHWHITYFLPYF